MVAWLMTGLLFVVIRQMLVDALRRRLIFVDVARIRVLWGRTDRELLFVLLGQHMLAPRRIIVAHRGLLSVER
jgi:hypothetical protein